MKRATESMTEVPAGVPGSLIDSLVLFQLRFCVEVLWRFSSHLSAYLARMHSRLDPVSYSGSADCHSDGRGSYVTLTAIKLWWFSVDAAIFEAHAVGSGWWV